MGEYASRGSSYAGPSHSSSAGTTYQSSPADRAQMAVESVRRQTTFVDRAFTELEAAHATNDLPRWRHAKEQLARSIVQAEKALERATAAATDETKAQLGQVKTALDADREKAHAVEPPRGYTVIECEDQLVAALRSNGDVQVLIEQSSIADLRVLQQRMADHRTEDTLVAEVWRLGTERRRELADFVRNVDRRKARERAAAVRGAARTEPLPEPETLETRLRRAFDGANVEAMLVSVIDAEDGTTRRALADRLRRYRPGNGDAVAARFTALPEATRKALFVELGKEKPRERSSVDPDPRDPMRAFRETKPDPAPETWADDPDPATAFDARAYLTKHASRVWSYVSADFGQRTWESGSPRAVIDEVHLGPLLFSELRAVATDLAQLAALVAPDDVMSAVATMIPSDVEVWVAGAATTVAQALARAIAPSVARMVQRFVAANDAVSGMTRPIDLLGHLPFSKPIDRVVARALAPNLTIAFARATKVDAKALVRSVHLRWQGAANEKMWNVLRAEPGDATVEEVAAVLAIDASLIAAVPPLFSVPLSWALNIPEARAHAPVALRRGPVAVTDESVSVRLSELATSVYGDEAASAQAARVTPLSPLALQQTFDESLVLLGSIRQLLAPFELSTEVSAAATWTSLKRSSVHDATPKQRGVLSAIAVAQLDRLKVVRSRIIAIAAHGSKAPERAVLRALADAAATAHLARTSDAALAEADTGATALYGRSLDVQAAAYATVIDNVHGRVDQDSAQRDRFDRPINDKQSSDELAAYDSQRARIQSIQQRIATGSNVDAAELDRVELDMEETTLVSRMHAVQMTLDQLSDSQILAAEGAIAHLVTTSKFRSLDGAIQHIRQSVGEIYNALNDAKRIPTSVDGTVSRIGDEVATRKRAIVRAEVAYSELQNDRDLQHFIAEASKVIGHQQTRTMLVKLVVQITAAIALSFVPGVGEALLYDATAFALEVVGNTAVQYGMATGERGADSGWTMLAENAFFVGAGRTIKAAMETGAGQTVMAFAKRQLGLLELQEARAAQAAAKGTFGGWMVKQAVSLSAETVLGVALGSIAAHAREAMGGKQAAGQSLEDAETQAVSITIGRLIHANVTAHMPRYLKMRELGRVGVRGELADLAIKLQVDAKHLTEHPESVKALALLDERLDFLNKERNALDELEAVHGTDAPSVEERAAMRADVNEQIGSLKSRAMVEMRWRMRGLHELGTDLWTGTLEQLDAAVSEARESGMSVVVAASDISHATVTIDGRTIELAVVSGAARTVSPAAPSGTDYGHIWPGEVPTAAPPEVRAVFEKAREVFEQLKKDGFQGGPRARMAWVKYLTDHQIEVEGRMNLDASRTEVFEHERAPMPAASPTALRSAAEMGPRSGNTGHVSLDRCELAIDELLHAGGVLDGATRSRNVVELKLAGAKRWKIEIGNPRAMADGEMSESSRHADREVVWVSDRLTDDQVPRALGAAFGEVLAKLGHAGVTPEVGALDAMFAHRETAANQAPSRGGSKVERAVADSHHESLARIDAEIDLSIARMGLFGPDSEARIADLPATLADKVRTQLTHAEHIGVRADRVVTHVEGPKDVGQVSPSKVMPDGVQHVHAYSPADYITVQELRVELEMIKEIDTRTALRDQPGTNGGANIAKGETQRRAPHVARARELMATLQLGSTDHAYLEARLAELTAVFPGIEKVVVPAIEMRIQRRERTADVHRQAEAFRAGRQTEIATITRLVASGTFVTDRIVVGAGPSALADVATLGVAKSGKVIDPTKVLVVGGPDLMDRIDPSFLWGQRGAVYDRSTNAHPAFSDANGVGSGELIEAIEDPGEFMHVGEMRDAMDRTRERLGMVAVDAQVLTVETFEQQRTANPWTEQGRHVRTLMKLGSNEVYVYSDHADITPGPGNPRLPGAPMLATENRDAMMASKQISPAISSSRGSSTCVASACSCSASGLPAHGRSRLRTTWVRNAWIGPISRVARKGPARRSPSRNGIANPGRVPTRRVQRPPTRRLSTWTGRNRPQIHVTRSTRRWIGFCRSSRPVPP